MLKLAVAMAVSFLITGETIGDLNVKNAFKGPATLALLMVEESFLQFINCEIPNFEVVTSSSNYITPFLNNCHFSYLHKF